MFWNPLAYDLPLHTPIPALPWIWKPWARAEKALRCVEQAQVWPAQHFLLRGRVPTQWCVTWTQSWKRREHTLTIWEQRCLSPSLWESRESPYVSVGNRKEEKQSYLQQECPSTVSPEPWGQGLKSRFKSPHDRTMNSFALRHNEEAVGMIT